MKSTDSAHKQRHTYRVDGMSCSHCVSSVTEEVSAIAGVASVDIDLPSGRMVVVGEGFADHDVRAAVDDAGYEIAP